MHNVFRAKWIFRPSILLYIQFQCLQNLLFHLQCGKCLKCETMHNGNDKHDNRWECARSVLVFAAHSLGENERYIEKKSWKTYTLIKLFKMTVALWYCCHKTCAQCNQNRTKIYDIASWNGTKHPSNFRKTITWHTHSDMYSTPIRISQKLYQIERQPLWCNIFHFHVFVESESSNNRIHSESKLFASTLCCPKRFYIHLGVVGWNMLPNFTQ